jgi:hypothetical protein
MRVLNLVLTRAASGIAGSAESATNAILFKHEFELLPQVCVVLKFIYSQISSVDSESSCHQMKTALPLTTLALFFAAFNSQLSTAFSQGSLTPPGPPVPTMKTLDQIQPRTAISSLPFFITNSGSYYLTAALTGNGATNGITILANHVTIDLAGFAILGAGGSFDGINVGAGSFNTYVNLTVRNGTIGGWGGYGINAYSTSNGRFESLLLTTNGITGLNSGYGTVASHCLAIANAGYGFDASPSAGTFDSCSALNNGAEGFHVSGSRVVNCVARANGGSGILAYNGSLVTGSLCSLNTKAGIALGVDCVALENSCLGNNSSGNSAFGGIYQFFGPGRIEGNHISYSAGYGIRIDDTVTKVVVIRNTTAGVLANSYHIPAGNDVGPWGQATTATSPMANIQN